MKKALIVGIDDYSGVPLSGCVTDANRMCDLLSKNEDGSPNFDCKKLTAPHQSVDKAMLHRHVKDLFVHEVDVALFYFSGHGTEKELGGYLVTQDTKEYSEGLSMVELLKLANDSKSHEVIIILDCCHSGSLGSLPLVENASAVLREGVSILVASRSSQAAMERSGEGVFTSLICDALEGGASDTIGNVTVASVYAYVDQLLGPWNQRPLFKSHVSRLRSLRNCKPEIPLQILRLLPVYFGTPTSVYPLDPSFEPESECPDPKNTKIFGNLQKYRAARLLVPIGEEHMYFAAMHNKSCKLTPIGQFYWKLVNERRI